MSEVFRKHYSYGETIPILDTHVGMTTDLFEVTGKPNAARPYLKAILSASAGPMKSPPMIVEPLLESDSRVVHLSNIPVPIPFVQSVDISLIFDIVNYRWTPSPELARDSGLVTFDLRLRAAFSVLGRSYTLQLDQRPCAITLARRFVPQQPEMQPETIAETRQPIGGFERPTAYSQTEERMISSIGDGGGTESFTSRLDVEERLRQLGNKLLVRP
ncbi:MAG TPA: hypothetical protein VMH02_10340 [Verrucomicrobiae bacterium]|nr:hypothetical protein [Verrucomicrobiae bacterium]